MHRSVDVAALVATLALGGCATVSRTSSYVSEVSPADAATLASSIADYLGQQLPPANTTLVLQPPAQSQAHNALTPALTRALQRAGFGVYPPTQDAPAPAGVHSIRYLVSPLNAGVLVRLQYDQTEASRWFARNSGRQLQAGSPFTVRAAP
jgi:hypothetical protein